MNSSPNEIPKGSKRIRLDWAIKLLLTPKRFFMDSGPFTGSAWFTPLLILSLVIIANSILVGSIKQQATSTGELPLPPDFEYYSPEDQARYMQAAQSTQSFAFVYVLPALSSLAGIWIGWLIVGGMLHLVSTLMGGRGDMGMAMNIVAWSNLPYAVRGIVRFIFMLITSRLIAKPGISGFSPVGDTPWAIFAGIMMALIDIYLIWQIILMVHGLKRTAGLTASKSTIGVMIIIGIFLLIQVGLGFAIDKISSLTVVRPFFF